MTNSDTPSENLNDYRNPDEVRLIERVASSDKKAIEKLYEKYREMILKISGSYLNKEVSNKQRIKIANQGLLIAANRFHDTVGINYTAYAAWWIRESFIKALKA